MPTPSASAAPFRLRVLGTLALAGPQGELLRGRRKLLTLLAYLAAHRRGVDRRALAALFWGAQSEQKARQSLRQALSEIGRALGDALNGGPDRAALVEGAVTTDAAELETAVTERRWADAAALWGGDFLAGAEDSGSAELCAWISGERTRLHRLLATACAAWCDELESATDVDGALAAAERWAEALPDADAPLVRRARVLLRAGRPADAIAVAAALRAHAHQRGEAPSPDVLRLEVDLQRGPSDALADFASAAAISRGTSSTAIAESVDARSPVARLLDAWREAVSGGGRTVLVRGGDASSRARAVDDFARSIQTSSVILRGRSSTDGRPYGNAAALLAPVLCADGLLGAPDDALADVAVLLPRLRERLPNLPARDGIPSTLARSVAQVLESVAFECPVALLVDDVASADGASRELIAALAADPPPATLVVLGAATADALPVDASAGRVRIIDIEKPSFDSVSRRTSPASTDRAMRPRRGWMRLAGVGVAAALVAGVLAVRFGEPRGEDDAPVLAVGVVRGTDAGAARLVPDVLASELARVPGLRVVSTTRMDEVVGRIPAGTDTAAAVSGAARRAGADELLEGTVLPEGDGLRMEVRRVDLRTGMVRQVASVSGTSAVVVAERAAGEVARGLGLRAAQEGGTSTVSPVALRMYREGVRAFDQADDAAATRLFRAALAEDTSFAMAALYLSRTLEGAEHAEMLARARRLARHASEPERLLISGSWAADRNEPSVRAVAETLAIRYPTEPDGHLLYAQALADGGEFLPAVAELKRVVRMDSASLVTPGDRCRACQALWAMDDAYLLADSLPAAERTARAWIAAQPRSVQAWGALVTPLLFQGRISEAEEAARRSAALAHQPVNLTDLAESTLRAARFDEAERLLAPQLARGTQSEVEDALWADVLLLRVQGRLREAYAAATRYRTLASAPPRAANDRMQQARLQALVLFDLGRYRQAAALWDSIAAVPFMPDSRARTARQRAWELAHEADALAAAGDTARLPALAVEIERLGRMSSYARDQRLHHHVRALLLAARGQHAQAADELRRAVYSPWAGYSRTNLELGRELLAAGRPAEAVAPLAAAASGPLGATGLYSTFTESRELLAQAYARLGRRQDAAAQARWVLAAWSHADPQFVARREAMRGYVAGR